MAARTPEVARRDHPRTALGLTEPQWRLILDRIEEYPCIVECLDERHDPRDIENACHALLRGDWQLARRSCGDDGIDDILFDAIDGATVLARYDGDIPPSVLACARRCEAKVSAFIERPVHFPRL